MRVPLLLLLLAGATPLAAQDSLLAPRPLTLLDAVRLGRARGVSAALARINARVAQTRVGQRRADLLPAIGGSAGVTRQTVNLDETGIPVATGVTDPFTVWRFRLAASQTLFDAAAFARLRAGKDSALAAGLDARAVGELAAATGGFAWLRTLSARETVRAREADSAVAADLLAQARQLVDAGVSPAIDLTRSEVSFAAVRTQLEVARNALDRARLDLVRALDLPPGAAVELADSLVLAPPAFPTDPDEAGRYARDHRPELAAERTRTAAARRNLGAIRAEYLPSIGLSGYYQRSARELGDLAGSYSVQLGVSVPILDGFRRQTRAQEQRVRLEGQELRERDLGNHVETEARQAALDLASAREQVVIAAERLRLAERELAEAQERFRAGVAGSVETTNAQGAVTGARDALIQARVSHGSAWVGLQRALGILDQAQ
ncbi:MAG TPA: TolC family protein [Gemmatimonadales bacterium]|nr:TolC family protein [Gemmatimonadales bacterium]